jgi:hypothetical protein
MIGAIQDITKKRRRAEIKIIETVIVQTKTIINTEANLKTNSQNFI